MKVLPKMLWSSSIASFGASLFFPAFYVGMKAAPFSSLSALVSGFFGLFVGYVCWLANPILLALWIAAICRVRPARIVAGGLAASGLCVSFLLHDSVYIDEAGGKASIVGLGLGYVLWLLSALLMLSCALVDLPPRKATSYEEPNKALEPTPTSVTPPADAGVAPAAGVAHL